MIAALHKTAYGWWILAGRAYLRRFDTETAARNFAALHGLEIV